MDLIFMKNGHAVCELIDTFWNVNKGGVAKTTSADIELIDTFWNVNPFSMLLRFPSIFELIATFWNINQQIQYYDIIFLFF